MSHTKGEFNEKIDDKHDFTALGNTQMKMHDSINYIVRRVNNQEYCEIITYLLIETKRC